MCFKEKEKGKETIGCVLAKMWARGGQIVQ